MKSSTLNFDQFEKVDKSTWLEEATRQLKGEHPEDRLSWASEFGLLLRSYYDASDLVGKEYLTNFFAKIKHHNWKLYERIDVTNVHEANIMALEALNGGCDGVLFSISQVLNLGALTKGILFEHCEVSFLIEEKLGNKISEFQNSQRIQGFTMVMGDRHSGWHSDRFSKSSGIKNLTEMVIDFAEHASTNPSIFLHVDQDFFHEMARVRAVRYLFWRVAEVLGMPLNPNDIWIHCALTGLEQMDENLFAQSTAALATIIGGTNSISFDHTGSNRRISRNVGNLIRDESKISNFQHAGSGSFFIDSLTDQMIQQVWGKLQKKLGS